MNFFPVAARSRYKNNKEWNKKEKDIHVASILHVIMYSRVVLTVFSLSYKFISNLDRIYTPYEHVRSLGCLVVAVSSNFLDSSSVYARH